MLAPDLGNLDHLVCRHAWDKELKYKHAQADGSPSWDSPATIGYSMLFKPAKQEPGNGLSTRVFAGVDGKWMSNAVTITIPSFEKSDLNYRAFHDYDFMKRLFSAVIQCWNPQHGLIFLNDFADKVDQEGLPGVGWFTYLKDPRAAALHNDIRLKHLICEQLEGGGTLITLDRHIIDAGNQQQVAQAKLLRGILIAQKLIQV